MVARIDPHLEDLFAPLGGVSMKRMFGGAGVFREGLMIALVTGDGLYFKADAETIPTFEAEGCRPFSYGRRDGRTTLTSYWSAPERVFDDPDAFREFATAAAAASRRVDAARASGKKGKR